jgi:beta-galactosidase GanA
MHIAPVVFAAGMASAGLHAEEAPQAPRSKLAVPNGPVALMVDGKPFRMLAGELGNSSASNIQDLKASFPKLAGMGLNTVLVPVSWELIEPQEQKWDFDLLGATLREARKNHLHLVLLWFGSWKNSMSSYAPAWVKQDKTRFPRAELSGGKPIEALSAFAPANLDADRRAFAALMHQLRTLDGKERTVLLVQVENEVAMVEEPMDRGPLAKKAWEAKVPEALVARLSAHRDNLPPDVSAAWRKTGYATAGTWRELFGSSAWAEELFMAWHYSRYVDDVAKAGKAEYPLPMFVNAALPRKGRLPGQYPSAGPVPHLIDAWIAGAPSIDLIAPDVYFGRLDQWCQWYSRSDNTLFIPEIKNDESTAIRALFAFGQGAIGFSPFAIETTKEEHATNLSRAYALMGGEASWTASPSAGILLDGDHPSRTIVHGGYLLQAHHDYTWPWGAPEGKKDPWPEAGGMVVALGEDEYLFFGAGFILTFASTDGKGQVGLERVDEGDLRKGRFEATRRLNGDETHQGRHVRLPPGQPGVQRVKLYRY